MTVAPLLFRDVPLGRAHRTGAGQAMLTGLDPGTTFSLEVQAHETVAVIGDDRSGVGLLAGLALALDRVPSGEILVLGTAMATLPRSEQLAFRRRIGYLPAGDGLLQNLSLRDNIRLPLRFGSDFLPREIEGRVDVIMAQLRLTHLADLRPAEVNDEDRRRAALGRALAFDPELVLLEESFDGLTDRAATEILEAARGGETEFGGRRTVFITGPDLPTLLRPRVDRTLRLLAGALEGAA